MTAITALDSAERARLRERAASCCVEYRNHPLPTGCVPRAGRIGVEDNGTTVLLQVDRKVRYVGLDAEVHAWVTAGTHAFSDLDTAIEWLSSKLPEPKVARAAAPTAVRYPTVDLDAVEAESEDATRPVSAPELEAAIREEVVGQAEAVNVIATTVAHHTAKMRPRRPVSILLYGPTGTGKTLVGERLATSLTALSGETWRSLRYDMNEYSERHAVARLHGAPPGYVGHGEGTSLASELAANPRCVVVFDEIDKAHPDVLTALMNLMDAGRLGSSDTGRPATRSVLLFTSNLAVAPGGDQEEMARRALIERGTRPEVVGRFRHMCGFTPLTGRQRAEVAARSVARVAADYGLSVSEIDPAYLRRVLNDTRHSTIGVRALEYLIDAQLGAQLAAQAAGTTVRVIGADPQVAPSARTDATAAPTSDASCLVPGDPTAGSPTNAQEKP
ncbi:Cdc48 subfamily AAA family protein [Jatrophihabitans sp. GAS493]|uniref:AAA family ATPase n=1 Tax=Jatrophihabitans sp. GAS493 TaxID=1907575 RepID=UPI000BB899F6|nr:AAA family ATPase [Jatrophihabitans sp. GAS493]SOD73525.1 Cdc48 subfamily AAA family protein [Jatrophihabitans sp. GAS493]